MGINSAWNSSRLFAHPVFFSLGGGDDRIATMVWVVPYDSHVACWTALLYDVPIFPTRIFLLSIIYAKRTLRGYVTIGQQYSLSERIALAVPMSFCVIFLHDTNITMVAHYNGDFHENERPPLVGEVSANFWG
jgi:hypothetical protein